MNDARTQKTALMNMASAAIAPLSDAEMLSVATEQEIALLTAWRKYRVLLNRVDINAPEWSEVPGHVT